MLDRKYKTSSRQPAKQRRRRSHTPKSKKAALNQLAGYRVGGQKIATLREVLDPAVPTMSLPELTEEQRVQLVLERLRREPDDFRIGIIGPGIIDKTRAIAEVESRSRIGRTIMEVEQNLLLRLTRIS
jgi:hypothetical protein